MTHDPAEPTVIVTPLVVDVLTTIHRERNAALNLRRAVETILIESTVAVATADKALTTSDLARQLHMPRTTVVRHLNMLVAMNRVKEVGDVYLAVTNPDDPLTETLAERVVNAVGRLKEARKPRLRVVRARVDPVGDLDDLAHGDVGEELVPNFNKPNRSATRVHPTPPTHNGRPIGRVLA